MRTTRPYYFNNVFHSAASSTQIITYIHSHKTSSESKESKWVEEKKVYFLLRYIYYHKTHGIFSMFWISYDVVILDL